MKRTLSILCIFLFLFSSLAFSGAQQPERQNKLLELKQKLEALKAQRQGFPPSDTTPAPPFLPPVAPGTLPIQSRPFLIGVSGFVPRNFPKSTPADWQDLFARLPQYGELFGVHTNWNDKPDAEGIPQQVHMAYNATQGKGVDPYISIGFEPDRLSQQEADSYIRVNGAAMTRAAVAIANHYHPKVMSLGVESNRYYEKSHSGYADYVEWCKQTYQAVKAVSPQTMVMNNFQLDYMRGGGKLSGRPHVAHWQLLRDMDSAMDVVSFTAYPFFDANSPDQIPSGYFHDIKSYTSKPIMITETAWPSTQRFVSGGSEQGQIEYLKVLLERLSGMNVYALVWIFPHDPNTGIAGGLFDDGSLYYNNGQPKPVFATWQALRSLPRT